MKDYTTTFGSASPQPNQQNSQGGGKSTKKTQDQLLTFDAGSTHHPPWFTNGLAWLGIAIGIVGNLMQVYTSDIAYQQLIRTNEVWLHMSKAGQAGAEPVIQIICFGVSVIFQLGLMYFVFRITQEFKNTKVQHGVKGMEAIKYTAVNIIDHQKVLLLWTIIAFAYDTLGDFTFINLYTDDPFSIFIYTAALYAASTVLLSKALEKQWAASIAYANWKSFRLYQKIQEATLASKQGKP
jgi:hypothetical protein